MIKYNFQMMLFTAMKPTTAFDDVPISTLALERILILPTEPTKQ